MSQEGYIYFLLNRAMPGLVKVGFTSGTLQERMTELESTGVPEPFVLGACFRVVDTRKAETLIHDTLANRRVRKQREFFKIALTEAVRLALESIQPLLIEQPSSEDYGKLSPMLDLHDQDIWILQMLAHDDDNHCLTIEHMVDHGQYPGHRLELENRLVRLADHGLVREVKYSRDSIAWQLTSRGIKFMFDRNLILKDCLER
jgi:hypothetical protein